MAFSVAPLLIHSEAVSEGARAALKAATFGPSEQRGAALQSAARLLFRETGLDCRDVRELVGLGSDEACQ